MPDGYWKIVIVGPDSVSDPIRTAAFMFDQANPPKLLDRVCSIDDVEEATGLDFLHELPSATETSIEDRTTSEWVTAWIENGAILWEEGPG